MEKAGRRKVLGTLARATMFRTEAIKYAMALGPWSADFLKTNKRKDGRVRGETVREGGQQR